MKNIFKNSKGFGAIEIIAIIAALALIGFAAWQYNAQSNQAKNSAETTRSPSATAEQSPAASAATAAPGTLSINEWGVEGVATGGLTLKYVIKTAGDGNRANFTSTQLAAADKSPDCAADSGINSGGGLIQRLQAGQRVLGIAGDDIPIEQYIALKDNQGRYTKVGDYYYVYYRPQGHCSNGENVDNIQNQTWDSMMGFLHSLKPIN